MSFVTDSILKTALGKIKAWGEGKFVAQESGKGLSTNDYTNIDKAYLTLYFQNYTSTYLLFSPF